MNFSTIAGWEGCDVRLKGARYTSMSTDPTLVGHVDLDAFFASAAELADPHLAGHCVAVGGKGVVASANYAARAKGVRAAMSVHEARSRCPELIVVAGDFAWYRELSSAVTAAVAQWAAQVESAGLDEAYVAFGSSVDWANVGDVVTRMRAQVRSDTGLALSVGVGMSRAIAKLASDAAKPDGQLIVTPERSRAFLYGRALADVGGAGPATLARLTSLGIERVDQLAEMDEAQVRSTLGSAGVDLWHKVRGEDGTSVHARGAPESVGTEESLEHTVTSAAGFLAALSRVGDEAIARVAATGRAVGRVSVKTRRLDYGEVSRSLSLDGPTNDATTVRRAISLVGKRAWEASGGAVRLVGVSLGGLSEVAQGRLPLGRAEETWELGAAPSAGMRVRHRVFGEGEVITGDDERAVVRFTRGVRVISNPRAHLVHEEREGT